MKRLIALALTVFALAAVPVAFGDDGSTPADTSAPAAIQAQGQRGRLLQLRIRIAERRFAKRCSTSANGASERCLDVAQKVEERVKALAQKVQDWLDGKTVSTSASSSESSLDQAAAGLGQLAGASG